VKNINPKAIDNNIQWSFKGGDFVCILRKFIKMDRKCGNFPIQLATLDLTGICLVLSKNHGITCIDTSTLDVIWYVNQGCFVLPPVKLWGDNFGSHFLVLCRESGEAGEGGREICEYWSPPLSYAMCEGNHFQRAVLPLRGPLLSATIETIGEGLGLLVSIVSNNRHIQLWRPMTDGINIIFLYSFFLFTIFIYII
jgi:hypothetical protein